MPDTPQLSTTDALVQLSFAIQAQFESRAAQEDLSVPQVRLLGILRDREPTMNELAGHLGLDKSSMSGLVARAERRGLVSRNRDNQDGRSVRVRLEPTGRALVEATADRFEADILRIVATLTDPERARWTALTTRMLVADADERGITL